MEKDEENAGGTDKTHAEQVDTEKASTQSTLIGELLMYDTLRHEPT